MAAKRPTPSFAAAQLYLWHRNPEPFFLKKKKNNNKLNGIYYKPSGPHNTLLMLFFYTDITIDALGFKRTCESQNNVEGKII